MGIYCCFSDEGGVRAIGILQINAAIYFFMSFTCLEKYWPVELGIFCVYLARVVSFMKWHLKLGNSNKIDRLVNYKDTHMLTCIPLFTVALTGIAMRWVEYGNIPLIPVLSWLCAVTAFNTYHGWQLIDIC